MPFAQGPVSIILGHCRLAVRKLWGVTGCPNIEIEDENWLIFPPGLTLMHACPCIVWMRTGTNVPTDPGALTRRSCHTLMPR